jgi:hypothetical protein
VLAIALSVIWAIVMRSRAERSAVAGIEDLHRRDVAATFSGDRLLPTPEAMMRSEWSRGAAEVGKAAIFEKDMREWKATPRGTALFTYRPHPQRRGPWRLGGRMAISIHFFASALARPRS